MFKNSIYTALVIGACAAAASDAMAASAAVDFGSAAPAVSPPGITLQIIPGAGRRRGAANVDPQYKTVLPKLDARQPADTDFIFANAEGLSLYFNSKDAACDETCTKTWAPALAPRGAKTVGLWSVVTRADGTKQWAHQDHPVYTNVADKRPGDANGAGAESGAWQSIAFKPTTNLTLPAGFSVKVVKPLNGQALVDQGGFTVYTFDGRQAAADQACNVSTCGKRWLPVRAPGLARNVGDFSVLPLAEGGKQWAYKGKPLFTYTEDINAGDAHGEGMDKWHAVVLTKYPAPSDVKVGYDDIRGAFFTKGGMTLYRQDVTDHASISRSIPYFRVGRPAVGRSIGVASGCSGNCLKTWKPFIAPKNAQPSGFWEITVREDTGERQWVYKGHAIYTYAHDKKSGDVNGDNVYERQDEKTNAVWRTGVEMGSILYWAPMPP